jgi:hypothetical protein
MFCPYFKTVDLQSKTLSKLVRSLTPEVLLLAFNNIPSGWLSNQTNTKIWRIKSANFDSFSEARVGFNLHYLVFRQIYV